MNIPKSKTHWLGRRRDELQSALTDPESFHLCQEQLVRWTMEVTEIQDEIKRLEEAETK